MSDIIERDGSRLRLVNHAEERALLREILLELREFSAEWDEMTAAAASRVELNHDD